MQYSARRAKGYASWTSPDAPKIERDTLQCVHCGGHWYVAPGSNTKRGWCRRCMGPHCGGTPCWRCVPFEKQLALMERREAFSKAVGLAQR